VYQSILVEEAASQSVVSNAKEASQED